MTTTQQPPTRKTSGFAIAAFLLVVLLPATPALYPVERSFGFPLFVTLGTVLGIIALRQVLARGKKGLTLALISLAFAAMWICWSVIQVWP
jgi:hypothetical protein